MDKPSRNSVQRENPFETPFKQQYHKLIVSGIVAFLFKSSLNKKKNAIANFIAKATKLATHSYMKNSLIPNLTKR